MSLTTKTILNINPNQNYFTTPMFDVNILLESVLLNLNRLQVKFKKDNLLNFSLNFIFKF